MKKTIIIISVCIAIGLLLWWLLSSPKRCDTAAGHNTQVVADHDTVDAHGVEYRRIIDSLSIDNYRLDSANKSLKVGQATTRKQLDVKTAEVKTLVEQIREINQDTGFFGHLLDSLQQQVESLTFLVVQYEQFADSVNTVNAAVYLNNASMLEYKDKRITELQAAYDNLFKAYQQLFADSQGLQKDLKKQKLKTKIAAVLGVAVGVLRLIK